APAPRPRAAPHPVFASKLVPGCRTRSVHRTSSAPRYELAFGDGEGVAVAGAPVWVSVHRYGVVRSCPQQVVAGCAVPGRGDRSGGVTPTPPPVLTTREHGFAALRPAIRSGELTRLRRGAYVWRAAEREPWQERQDAILARCAAVAARFTTRYAFSHATAALLHGWPVTTLDDRIRVTQTVNPGGSSTPDVLRHVRADLPDGDLTTVAGLLVTTPDRTVLDCARYLPPDRGLVVVDGALRSLARMSPHRRSESEARQEATRSRLLGQLATIGPARGTARARAVLAVATGFAATPPESRLRWAALAAGLPEPVAQLPIEIGSRLFFADLAWVGDD